MSLAAASLRRAAGPGHAALAAGLGPWAQALRAALSTLAAGAEASSAAPSIASSASSSAAVRPPPPPPHAHRPLSLEAQRAPALAMRQRMQAAAGRGEYSEVLQLLEAGEAAAAELRWHPLDRAALYDCALRACAACGDAEQARHLVDSMWRQAVPVGIVANTALLRALCAAGRHAAALQHLRGIPAKRQRTPMFALVLRSCIDAGTSCDLAAAQDCLSLFRKRQHTPDAQWQAELIRLHGAAGDAAAAEAVWREAAGAAANDGERASLQAAWVAALARSGQLEAAVAAVGDMLNAFSSLLPIDTSRSLREAAEAEAEAEAAAAGGDAGRQASLAQQREQQQQQRREQQRREHQASPVRHMQDARNAVLRAAQERGDAAAARRVASLATMRGLPPDVGTYNALLRAAIAHGDGLEAVLDGVRELRRLGLLPDRETYSLVLKACTAAGDAAAAQAALDAMPGDGVAAGRAHHNALLAAYAAAGDLQGADAAYGRMQAAGFPGDAVTFRALLGSVRQWAALETEGRAGSEEGSLAASNERTHQRQVAAALLERWVHDLDAARPCVLTPALFTALLHAYSHSGQAMQVLLLMRDAFGCQLSPQTSSTLGGGGGSGRGGGSGQPAAAAAAADSGSPGGATPISSGSGSSSQDAASDAAVGQPSSSSSGGAAAASIAGPLSPKTLERAQLAPSLPAFNAAISACTRVGHRHMADAVALLRCMLAAGLSPDAHTYTSLISGCAYGRQAALAREMLRQMQQRGIQPTTWTHNALLKVECWTYGVDPGLALLRRMVQQGMQPDRATWSTLLAAAKHAQRADVAQLAQAELEQLSGRSQAEGASAEAADAATDDAAAAAAAAAEADHKWHGYYEQQQDEEEDW